MLAETLARFWSLLASEGTSLAGDERMVLGREGANPRYIRHRETHHACMCTFRTQRGTVFAFERVTINADNLWPLPTCAVQNAAQREGVCAKLKPPGPKGKKYGRLSALNSIAELKDQPLLAAPVCSVPQTAHMFAQLP